MYVFSQVFTPKSNGIYPSNTHTKSSSVPVVVSVSEVKKPSSSGTPIQNGGGSVIKQSARSQLESLAKALGVSVAFQDFPKTAEGGKIEYVTIVNLSTTPPKVNLNYLMDKWKFLREMPHDCYIET